MKFPTVDHQLSYREMYDRWQTLKRFLEEGLIEFGQFKECHTGKWEEAYRALLAKMKELEEK